MADPGTEEERKPLRPSGFLTREESTEYHVHRLWKTAQESIRPIRHSIRPIQHDASGRLNLVVLYLWIVTVILLCSVVGYFGYVDIYGPIHNKHALEHKVQEHAAAARLRVEQCRGYTWETACDALGNAGARRRRRILKKNTQHDEDDYFQSNDALENGILDSDDPTIVYDQFCLRKYRLTMHGGITFPYHSGQLLTKGGNQTCEFNYSFCSFKY